MMSTMSKSILKSPEDKRLVTIPVNEGSDSSSSTNSVSQWTPMDDDPFIQDFNREMHRVQKDMNKMHHNMMTPFPGNNGFNDNMMMAPPPQMLPPPPPFKLPPMPAFPALPGVPHVESAGFPNMAMVPAVPPPMSLSPMRLPNGADTFNGGMDMMPLPTGPTPVIVNYGHGNKGVELTLDVKGYQPEDIQINTEGPVLFVTARRSSAKHEGGKDSVADCKMARLFKRQYTLPEVVRAENLRCYVNPDGYLTIEGPLGAEILRQKMNTKKKVKFAALYK